MKFLPQSDLYENGERELKPISYPEYLYLSGFAFLVILTSPNKQLAKVKPASKSPDYVSNS